jgi:hypothetical protein
MHKKGLIAAIQTSTKQTLREYNTTDKRNSLDADFRLPFNDEFKIFLRNRRNECVGVSIFVDDVSVFSEDGKLVLYPNESYTVEGFDTGEKFIFLDSRSKEAHELGRVSSQKENGIIQIKFYKATKSNVYNAKHKRRRTIPETSWDWRWEWPTYPYPINPPTDIYPKYPYDITWTYKTTSSSTYDHDSPHAYNNYKSLTYPENVNKKQTVDNLIDCLGDGVIERSTDMHNQIYEESYVELEHNHCVEFKFKITGFHESEHKKVPVQQPITYRSKFQCMHCMNEVSPDDKYCKNCGKELTTLLKM